MHNIRTSYPALISFMIAYFMAMRTSTRQLREDESSLRGEDIVCMASGLPQAACGMMEENVTVASRQTYEGAHVAACDTWTGDKASFRNSRLIRLLYF